MIVPPYIEVGDMIMVQGQQKTDIWYAKCLELNERKKIAVVVFFQQTRKDATVFVRESKGHLARIQYPSSQLLVCLLETGWQMALGRKQKAKSFNICVVLTTFQCWYQKDICLIHRLVKSYVICYRVIFRCIPNFPCSNTA